MTPLFDFLTFPFLHKYSVCLGFAGWLMRLGLISALRGHLKIMWFSGTQKHPHIHNLHFQYGIEFFGLLGTNVILGVFNLTKMHSLLMKDRGEIKNTLWNPVIETLIIYFLAWDLFTCSSWFKTTWNISTRLTWLKTNLCWQQNQTDRNRTIVFSCHKNVTKQHIVSCVFALCSSWLNYEILFTKKTL